jgi:recombinase
VTLPQGRNGLRARRMAVLSTFREPSLYRHVRRELLRNVVLDFIPIIPPTACHQSNDVEAYSRYTPQEPPQSTPHEAPRDMPHQAPQSAPQLLSAYDQEAAVARMQALRREGLSFTRIADQLTAEGVPTRYGLPWQHSSVRYLLRTWMVGGGLWSETRVSRHNTLLSLPASCRRGNGVVRRNQRKDPYAHL